MAEEGHGRPTTVRAQRKGRHLKPTNVGEGGDNNLGDDNRRCLRCHIGDHTNPDCNAEEEDIRPSCRFTFICSGLADTRDKCVLLS